MKSMSIWVGVLVVLCAGLLWSSRGFWRDTYEVAMQPTIPPATIYRISDQPTLAVPTGTRPQKKPGAGATTSVQIAVAEPSQASVELPKEINLAVPFLSQAPKQNWAMPFQEACEEASMIMVDAYFSDRTKTFAGDEGERAILDIVAFETKQGLGTDIAAKQVADLIPEYFTKRQARIITNPTREEIQSFLAKGIPVIVPADGKALKNPNFHNGGPSYHMLVIKGYLADGRWIVNDPGTRKGADYVYDRDLLFNAIHDWNGGDVPRGAPVVIIMQPTKK